MELRTLEYFMEIAREGNMSRAAEKLHVSQPSLSKQMKALEQELGKKLFVRDHTGLSLTDEGMLLRKRAEDILGMVRKTEDEFQALDDITGGDVQIGCAESYQMRHLARIIKDFKKQYPLFIYHLTSGNTEQVVERLDRGLLDFAVIVEPPDLNKYNYIEIPGYDTFGLLVRRDHELADKEHITAEDLKDVELIVSDQSIKNDISRWCGEDADKLKVTGTVNLFYNGSVFVREGLGAMLTFEHLPDTHEDQGLVFIPLYPRLEVKMYIIWKKYQVFTPIASLLLNAFQNGLKKEESI